MAPVSVRDSRAGLVATKGAKIEAAAAEHLPKHRCSEEVSCETDQTWLGLGSGVGVGVGVGLANPHPNPNPNQDQTCPSMVIVHRLGQRRKANQHVSRVISPLSSITRCSCMPG